MKTYTKEQLGEMTIAELTQVHNALTGKSVKKVKGSSAKIVGEILKMQPAQPARVERKGGKSIKSLLRELYADKSAAYTEEELQAKIDGTWASIRSTISDLKNTKYADGPLLIIQRDKETGEFRRAS